MAATASIPPLPQPPSIDEKLASFDSVPLFMKSLPEDDTDNDALGALQSLAFDGTPDGG
jgi:small subunit ribosomal protein S7e